MKNKVHEKNNQDICYVRKEDECFPKRLLELADCPKGIYVRGRLSDPEKKVVAIVGARMCSPYGRAAASYFAQVFAAHGV